MKSIMFVCIALIINKREENWFLHFSMKESNENL